MSMLSQFIRNLCTRPAPTAPAAPQVRATPPETQSAAPTPYDSEIAVTGEKPYRMATYVRDRFIGQSIRNSGHGEERAILDVIQFIGRHPGRATFLDIGANIGTHALFALQNGFDRAVCIEPDPDNYVLLRVNQILNGVDAQCVNINAAASISAGVLQFELSETNFGDHRVRLASDCGKYAEQDRKVINVPADTIDALLTRASISPAEIGLTWIDTQGHEGHVLSGASTLTDANVPIVIEFWPYGLKRSGGYPLVREFLGRQHRILDIRKPLAGQTSIKTDELDRLYSDWLDKETAEAAVHTDLLILPRQG